MYSIHVIFWTWDNCVVQIFIHIYLKASWTAVSISFNLQLSYLNVCPANINHRELSTAMSKAVCICTAPYRLLCCRCSTSFRASTLNCRFIIDWPMPNVRRCFIVNLRHCDHAFPSVNTIPVERENRAKDMTIVFSV